MHAVRFFRVGYPFSERWNPVSGVGAPYASWPWPCLPIGDTNDMCALAVPIGDTWADTHQRAFQGELGETWAGRPARRRPCSCAQDGA